MHVVKVVESRAIGFREQQELMEGRLGLPAFLEYGNDGRNACTKYDARAHTRGD